jgi:flagellar hook-length control protein FliK
MVDKLTPETMHDVTRRVDISFDRALAELEMNKAEYGTPDQQVAKSVADNLLRGRSEFTVKLKPEGLGEILVKLVSDDVGKTILSMVASSQRTADLLNKDLASLQTQLNSQGVEIENNSVKVSETVMPADHQSDAAFSQFDQRRRDEGEQENRYRQVRKKLNTDDIKIGSTEFDTDIEVGRTSVDDQALNITI